MSGEKALVPELRFPEFAREWKEKRLGAFFEEFREKSTEPDQYEVMTSARSGLVSQREYYGEGRIVDRNNVGFNVIPPNYITYRSRSDDRRFFFNENTTGQTGIISVYYPVFRIKNGSNKFFIELLATKQHHIGKYSVGTSQTVLSLNELKRIKLCIPEAAEQQKIAAFLDAVSKKITLLTQKREALTDYKRGLMQQLFSGALRFTRPDGSAFPDWEERRLSDVLTEHRQKNEDGYPVFSVSVAVGLINQIEHLGRSFAANDTSHYNRVNYGDIVYTKSPTGDFPLGIIKQSRVREPVAVSPLYGVFRPETEALGYILHVLFESPIATQNYLHALVQKGAKNTISVTNKRFLEGKLTLPSDPEEQTKIANALSALDVKIDAVSAQISQMETFKKGLLQKMFV